MLRSPMWIPALALTCLAFAPTDALGMKSGRAHSAQVTLEKSGAHLRLPALDVATFENEDALREAKAGTALRYGRVYSAGAIAIGEDSRLGQWTKLADGRMTWSMEVAAEGARTLEFAFSSFYLPPTARLVIRSADGAQELATLSDADNPLKGGLYSAMLSAERAVLELTVSPEMRDAVRVTLSSVIWGYRDPFTAMAAKSGSCNVDTACPEGDAWRDQIAATAGYAFSETGDRLMCTGTLMNTGNPEQDRLHPRLSTAYHCVSSESAAESMVFYWGYESPTCRSPGSLTSGTPLPVRENTRAVQLGGATLLATHRGTDFTAVELKRQVPSEAQVYYSGWDRSGVAPAASVGIHHPSGDEKRITFNDVPLTTTRNCIIASTDTTTHWAVGPYSQGTTERGSSGSGLWDKSNGLLIGVLSGGTAACGAPDGDDCYGRLSSAWEVQTSTGTLIRDAFDRTGTNPVTMEGRTSCDAPTVALSSSSAFEQPIVAGRLFDITANATGGSGASYTYLWDLDGDGRVERETQSNKVSGVSFPSKRSLNVRVSVRDSEGCIGTASRAIEVVGPEVEVVSFGAPEQVCGNDNGQMDPGESFNVPVTVRNKGGFALPEGSRALFLPSTDLVGNGTTNTFGYQGASQCDYDFVDIAQGPFAVTPLETYVADGNSYGPNDDARSVEITLGGEGFELFGNRQSIAVMSTNGYISFDPNETGADWSVSCDGELDQGALGPQLRPYHDDMVVNDEENTNAGLRYRYFEQCPRPAVSGLTQGCHVFQWTGMSYYTASGMEGDFDFQAIAYEITGEVAYQYQNASPDEGDLANIGLIGVDGADPLNLSCESGSQPTPARSAMCIHSPQALAMAQKGFSLRQPTVQVPMIRPNESATVHLPVVVSREAACGKPLKVDYLATVSTRRFSADKSNHVMATVGDSCAPVTRCSMRIPQMPLADGAMENPRSNALAGGIEQYASHGGLWRTGDTSHSPTWYRFQGAYVDNVMSADLLQAKNLGDSDTLEVEETKVGTIHIARLSRTRAMFVWEFLDGRRGTEYLQITDNSPAMSGQWASPESLGWWLGVSRGVNAAATPEDTLRLYLFDAFGNPRWVAGKTEAQGVATLKSTQTLCPACAYVGNWNDASDAGTARIEWINSNEAVLDTDIVFPAPLRGEWQRDETPLLRVKDVN